MGLNIYKFQPAMSSEDATDGSKEQKVEEKNSDRGMLTRNASAYPSTRHILG